MGKIKRKRVKEDIEKTEQVEPHAVQIKDKMKKKIKDQRLNNTEPYLLTEGKCALTIADAADEKTKKKPKKKLDTSEQVGSTVSVEPIARTKKSKRSNKDLITDIKEIDREEEHTGIQSAKKKRKKEKDDVLNDAAIQSSTKNKDIVNVSDIKANKSKKKQDVKDTETIFSVVPNTSIRKKVKNKKILFENDEPQGEVTSSGANNIRKKKNLNEDEAEVKDEDIDKFCDEVDDDDNKVYEDWVQLIEAKLRSNVKKGK